MSATLIASDVWPAIKRAVKRTTHSAYVAVAYFGQGAAKLLPLPPGSRLVVDASELAVKSGQTCPAELAKLQKRGVDVYSAPNLHAKVFVLGARTFVGSANVSGRSADLLVEAVVVTNERSVVSSARRFVRGLCLHKLGPEAIARLMKMYRAPRFVGPHERPKGRDEGRRPVVATPRVLLAQLKLKEPPAGSESAEEHGRKAAQKRMERRRQHDLENFWHRGKCPYRLGDVVIQVLDEGGGRRMVSPPGTVVHLRAWQGRQLATTFVYLEVPRRNRVALDRLARRIGRGGRKRLTRGGQVRQDFPERLLQAWNQ